MNALRGPGDFNAIPKQYFTTYLSNRKQIVVVYGQKSDTLDVKAGVPQGTRLWPLLFLIYMIDITDDIESDILIFADDTSLFATGMDPAEPAEILKRDLQKSYLLLPKLKM
jgi:hypothetical protein